MLCQELQLEVTALSMQAVWPGYLVTEVDTDLGMAPGCPITCFRPPTPTLQPRNAQEGMRIVALWVTEMLLSRSPCTITIDCMLAPDLSLQFAGVAARLQAELQFYLALASRCPPSSSDWPSSCTCQAPPALLPAWSLVEAWI